MTLKLRINELLAKKARKEGRKLTYRVIANETGLSERTISGYLNNTIRRYDADTLQVWQKYLDVPTSEFFVDEPEEEESLDGELARVG